MLIPINNKLWRIKGLLPCQNHYNYLSAWLLAVYWLLRSLMLTQLDNSEAEEMLLISAYEGDIDKVKDLLAKGVDVNAQGYNDETPLLAAVNSGKSRYDGVIAVLWR